MVQNARIILLKYMSNRGTKNARKNQRELQECFKTTLSLEIKQMAVFGLEHLEF